MAFESILTSQDGASAVITLNRPDRRNAFSVRMMQEIATACASAEEDPSVRGVIVTGGPRYFSAGADLNEAMAIKSTADGVAYMTHWETLNNAVERLAKPVIAAIEGFCMTGGWESRDGLRYPDRGRERVLRVDLLPDRHGPGRGRNPAAAATRGRRTCARDPVLRRADRRQRGLPDGRREPGGARRRDPGCCQGDGEGLREAGSLSLAYAKRAVRAGVQKAAAKMDETLYGMLAVEQLGLALPQTHTAPDFTQNDWQKLRDESNIRTAVGLAEIGRDGLADEVLRHQARLGPANEYQPLTPPWRAI